MGDCGGEGVCGCNDDVVVVVERVCMAAMMMWCCETYIIPIKDLS